MIKGYYLGGKIKIACEDTHSEEELRANDISPEVDYINFEQHKSAKKQYKVDKTDPLYIEIEALSKIIKDTYKLEVFGFDLIKPPTVEEYLFIDINSFVSCKFIDNQNEIYQETIKRKIDEQTKE